MLKRPVATIFPSCQSSYRYKVAATPAEGSDVYRYRRSPAESDETSTRRVSCSWNQLLVVKTDTLLPRGLFVVAEKLSRRGLRRGDQTSLGRRQPRL